MSPRRLAEHEPARGWMPVPRRLDRLSALCAKWGWGFEVLTISGRYTRVELSAYGVSWTMGLRDCEISVGAFIESELDEAAAHRTRAGYPAELVGSPS